MEEIFIPQNRKDIKPDKGEAGIPGDRDFIGRVLGVKPEEEWAKGKYRRIVETRSLLCYWAVRELGVPMSSLAQRLGISIPSVSESVTRGQRIAEAKGYILLKT